MENVVRKVSKCHLIFKFLLIVLSLLITSGEYQKKEEVLVDILSPEMRNFKVTNIVRMVYENRTDLNKQDTLKENIVESDEEPQDNSAWTTFKMTHYVSNCRGCSGITASGYDVRNTIEYEGMRVLAVDPKVIKEGSVLEVKVGENTFKAIALDTGGKIKGNKLDLLVEGVQYALQQGIKQVEVKVVRDGWQEEEGKERQKTHL